MDSANLTAKYLQECMVNPRPQKRDVNLQEACRTLVNRLDIPNCSEDRLITSLNSKRVITLSAIVHATEKGIIDIKEKSGKEIWRNVFEYLPKRDLRDELAIMEEAFYHASTSRLRQDILSIKVDFLTAVVKCVSFGLISTSDISDYFGGRAYERFICRRLYDRKREGAYFEFLM